MPLGNLRQQKSKIIPVKQPRPIPVKQPRPGMQQPRAGILGNISQYINQVKPGMQQHSPGGFLGGISNYIKQPLPSLGTQQPRPGVMPLPSPNNPPNLIGKDNPFFNSEEFNKVKNYSGPATNAMYNSPYFGSISSSTIGGMQDKAYQDYMTRIGTPIAPVSQQPGMMQQPFPISGQPGMRQQPAPGGMAQPVPAGLAEMLASYQPSKFQQPGMAQPLPTAPNFGQPRLIPGADIQFGVQPLPAAPSAAPRPYLNHDLPKNFEPGMQQLLPSPGMQQPAPSGFGGLAEYALRQQPAPLQQAPLPAAPNFAGQIPGAQQQAPLQQQAFSYGGRAGYQMGGIIRLENDQDVFSRLENLNQNLDQVEQTLGTPYNNQSYGSPIFDALTGSSQMNLGGRIGYQEGGIGMMQDQGMYNPLQSITSSPMLNYGQTPLTMAGGGITRLGYQEGGMDQMMMEPQMQDQAMMQPQMQQAPEGIMNAMPQEAGGGQQTQLGEGDNALLTIIQLLIEQGLDPETAQRVARQILQAFAQGGEPAVEALANQFDQQMEQAPVMMATGGLTNLEQARQMLQNKAPSGEFLAYINPQEAAVLKRMGGAGRDINNTGVPSFIFKAIGKAIKSITKSSIGKIALTIGATMLLGPAGAGFTGGMFGAAGLGASLTTNAFLAGAINAGAANLLVQGITTGKFNPKEALMASVLGGATGYLNPASAGISGASSVPGAESLLKSGVATPTEVFTSPGTLSSGVTGATSSPTNYFSPTESQYAGQGQYTAPATPPSMPQPNLIDKGIMSARQAGEYLSETGTNFMQDPIATLGRGFTNVKDFAGENKEATLAAATLGLSSLAQQPGESNDEYASRAARDPQVAAYITRYGGGIGLRSSPFYQMEKAVDPFAGTSLATSTNPFYPQGYSMGGRIGYEYGSMPMGEPRKNPAGIMELDYRAKGGFVPPVGIKEKADDIPAMLSNNEFVFTADAVRNAGGGNVNKGAQRMYGLMKQLEAGGRV